MQSCLVCPAPSEFRCDYVGRDNLRCPSVWCALHVTNLDGRYFCRRHLRIQSALHDGITPPALHDRAPSLVLHTVDDISADLASQLGGSTVISPLPLRELSLPNGLSGWEAGWHVAHARNNSNVTIFVAGAASRQINLRVNEKLIPVGEPPWMKQRSTELVTQMDTELRKLFRERLLSTVLLAIGIAAASAT
jgi:hypothetical protein